MAEDTDRSSKTEAPTQRRLDEARRKGEVAKTPDIPSFMALAAAVAVTVAGGGWIARSIAESLLPFLARPHAIDLSGGGGAGVMRAAASAGLPAALVLAAAAAAGVAGNLIQHGLIWTPSKLAPDFSKLNPMQGLGRLFGLDGLVNFFKSLAKVLAVALVAWTVLKGRMTSLQELPGLAPAAILPLSFEILRSLAFAVLAVMAAVAAADWLWTRYRFTARMRMSREEVRQDHRESEGDPHVKGRQKQIRLQRSRQRMIQNVPKATVVVMNPTHYAVALRYEQGETAAPVCVAKGVDRVALKIREVAEAAKVPIVEDPPLARALFAAIDVDEAIPHEHYHAVAQIIGFIMGAGARRAAPLRP